jgi:hypothetical protein
MILKRNKPLKKGWPLLLLVFTIPALYGQPAVELADWQKKYPGSAVVVSTKKLSAVIDVVEGRPQMTLDEYKEIIVLADNSTFLADSREYFSNHFKVQKLEAYSLIPEQKQYRKLPVTKFNKTVEIDNSVFYDDQYAFAFTFPSVGKGTRLVTRSVATSQYTYLPVVFDFGGVLPAENMELTLSFPKIVRINYHLFGRDTAVVKFSSSVRGDRVFYTWRADNPKSYERDTEAPSLRYFIPHIVIQLAGFTVDGKYNPVIGSLEDLYAYNYSNISGLPADPSEDIVKLADSVVASCPDDRSRVRCIFAWVQKNIKYVAIEDGDNGVVPREASLVHTRRYGDCKDKTSILVAMIRSQGLRASYAWVGSRSLPYKYSEFPSVLNDDHMIAVWWDGEEPVILDGTTFSHRMEDTPAFIQGKECMIDKGKNDFLLYTIPVASPAMNAVYDSLAMRLQGDTVLGHGFASFTGELKANIIARFEGKDTSAWPGIVREQLPRATNKLTISRVSISDIGNLDQPFTVSYDFYVPGYMIRGNNQAYVNLYLNRFLQNTVIREDRWMPLESEMTLDHSYVCTLEIPEGYQVKHLPENSSFENPGFRFREYYNETEESVLLASRVTLNFQVIEGEEMEQFREMLGLLNRSYLRSIPLEKTNTL